jgi:molecular chaperone GrpE
MVKRIPIEDEDGADAKAETENIAEQQAEQDALAQAQEKIAELEKTRAEYLDMLQRMKAEFENYKRRTTKEKADALKYGHSRLAEKLLPVLDNLQRGLKFAAGGEADAKILEGMSLVERQMLDVLAEFNVVPFDSVGEFFDPNIHEALYTVDSPDAEDNRITEEVEKGFRIDEKLLRPAKVVVCRKQQAQ